MNILFWKKNKEIDAMAISLADDFFSHIQPQLAIDYLKDSEKSSKTKKANKNNSKVEKAINNTASQIIAFRKQLSLGVYGKARLHLSFIKRLNELGYPEDVTNQINETILLRSP